MASDKTQRDRFVDSMRVIRFASCYGSSHRKSIEAACDAFADATCERSVWELEHREQHRATLRREVFGE